MCVKSVLHRVVDDVERHEPFEPASSVHVGPEQFTRVMGLHTFHGPKSSRNSVLPCFAKSQSIHGRPQLTLGLLIRLQKTEHAGGRARGRDPKSAALGHVRVVALAPRIDLLGGPLFHAIPWCARANHVRDLGRIFKVCAVRFVGQLKQRILRRFHAPKVRSTHAPIYARRSPFEASVLPAIASLKS